VIANIVYGLCAITCLICAALLTRGYRRSGARLLLWSTLCFVLLSLNNVLLVLDRVVFVEEIDLYDLRLVTAGISAGLLLYGLIWDVER